MSRNNTNKRCVMQSSSIKRRSLRGRYQRVKDGNTGIGDTGIEDEDIGEDPEAYISHQQRFSSAYGF